MFSWIKNRNYVLGILATFIVIFDLSLFVLWKTPGGDGTICLIGGSFTAANIIFSFAMSGLLSLSFVGLLEVMKHKKNKDSVKLAGVSGFGLLFWGMSTMCIACYAPLLTVFGAGVSLHFLSDYSGIMKVVSLVIGVLGVMMIDRQIRYGCLNPENCEL